MDAFLGWFGRYRKEMLFLNLALNLLNYYNLWHGAPGSSWILLLVQIGLSLQLIALQLRGEQGLDD